MHKHVPLDEGLFDGYRIIWLPTVRPQSLLTILVIPSPVAEYHLKAFDASKGLPRAPPLLDYETDENTHRSRSSLDVS
ncbi:hypothetical protein BDW75DRAFT_212737 [Aspergillus navahoensis]